jgi:N4-gp56 family major capsid protein
MAINTYTGTAAGGQQTNLYAVVQLLKSVDAVEVLDRFTQTIPVPANKSETVGMLRAVTPDPNVTEVAEGVNPAPRALTYEQVTKTFEEYAEVFAVTSRMAELGEYDVIMHSKDRLMDLIKRTREKNAWYEYRAGTSVLYNSSAITARANVNGALTINRLRIASRTLHNNRAAYMREMTKGSINIGTVPVEPAFVVLCHTDCRADIRAIPGFIPAAQVGGMRDAMPQLFGYVDEFAFVTSPEFEPFLAGGAAVGSTGMKSVGGANVDVYVYLVVGAQSLGKCNLRAANGGTQVSIEVLNKADKSDPTNQRRLIAARWWDAPVILNQSWLVRIEAGVTDQPTV